MKQLKMTLLIGLLSLILAPSIVAQNIDAHRMKRDIRIMENILSELFRTQTEIATADSYTCLLYTSPSPRDRTRSRMPSSA